MILKPSYGPTGRSLASLLSYHTGAALGLRSCYFTKKSILKNLKSFTQMRCVSNACLNFPWRQDVNDKSKDDPVHHKLVGMILLRRILKNYSREEFNLIEFINGVKHAIMVLSHSIQSYDHDGYMSRMLGSGLQTRFRQAFDEMKKAKERIILEVESTRDLRISGVRAIFGNADPGDEYYISCLGQKIITSKRDMFELEKRVDSSDYSTLFDYGKKLGISAAEKQLRIQIDVMFTTSERYYVEKREENGWHVVFGCIDMVSPAHKLRFESYLHDQDALPDNFPLFWKIVDIDYADNETACESNGS